MTGPHDPGRSGLTIQAGPPHAATMSPGGTPILHATCPRGQCFGLQPTSRTDVFSSLLAFSRVAGNLPRFLLARLLAGVLRFESSLQVGNPNRPRDESRVTTRALHSTARLTSQPYLTPACTEQTALLLCWPTTRALGPPAAAWHAAQSALPRDRESSQHGEHGLGTDVPPTRASAGRRRGSQGSTFYILML